MKNHQDKEIMDEHIHDEEEEITKLDIFLYIISILLFILTIFIVPNNLKIIGYLITLLLSGSKLLIEGIKKLIKFNFEEETLMSIAIIAAFILGEYEESCLVILLFKIGEFLEHKAIETSNKNINLIANIKEEFANLIEDNGEEKKVHSQDVKVGQKILIKQGERVPLDSIVIQGEANIDTSAITGESMPIVVKEGSKVLSGSINIKGVIVAQVEKDYENSMTTQIVDLVYEAKNNKGKTEKFITKFSKVYTPVVMVIALIIAIMPPLMGILDFRTWIERALIFLVASCPCSIVISVPVAMYAGVGKIGKRGLLLKGTKHIENFAQTKIAVFDKTGTLTTGKMKIDKIEILGNYTQDEIMSYIVSIEKYSNHPIANVFTEYRDKTKLQEVKGFEEIPGLGVYGVIADKEVVFGNKKIFQKYKIDIPNNVNHATFLSINKVIAAYVTLKEEIKEENINIVSNLKKEGIKKVVMLTGDNEKASEIVGRKLHIDEMYAELLPEQKKQKLIELKNRYKDKVIFVGDGINDSIVLSTADFGISMGLGQEIANQVSDAILITNKIEIIPDCIKTAKKSVNIAKFNIGFSLIIKAIVFVLGFFGIAPIWLAVLADTGVTMITVANSMRIIKSK